MMKVFTKEELESFEERTLTKTNKWLESLSSKEKKYLYDRYYVIFKQIKCRHKNLNKIPSYDTNQYYCQDCDISFTESEIREQKIDEILKGDN